MKSTFCILISIILSINLCGCWGYIDINELNILYGVGFDITKDNKYIITMEGRAPTQQKSDAKDTVNINYSKAIGDSIFDAARNLTKNSSGKRSYYQTCQTIVLGRKICETSITPVIDFITRDPKRRSTIYPIVFDDDISDFFLKGDKLYEPLSSEIVDIIKLYKYTGYAVDINLAEAISKSRNISGTVLLNKFKFASNDTGNLGPVLDGTGVFYDNKLVGYFDLQDTMVANIISQKIKQTLIVLSEDINGEPYNNMTIELSKFKTKFDPMIKDNKYLMNIDISANATIIEYSQDKSLIDYDYKKLEKLISEQMKSLINKTFFKCKTQFKVDALGLGNKFQRKYKNISKIGSEEWNNIFYNNMDLNINIKINIVSTGATLEKKAINRGVIMIYSILLISIAITIYYYNNLMLHSNNIKIFRVVILIIIIGILYMLSINNLKDYSLVKILKTLSKIIIPWFIRFMESNK